MKQFFRYIAIAFIIGNISCQPENEIIIDQPGNSLLFSSDTISFDTVFTSLGSATRRLIVSNPNENAVKLNQVYLGTGTESPYEITVSGDNQKQIFDQTILGNDSILILITVTIDPTSDNLPFIVRDSIVFLGNDFMQDVKLSGWGQNAHFLGDSILECDAVWSNDLPYFLSGSILVDSLCNLTINPGTQIYSSYNAYLFVKGTLIINGTEDNRVLATSERLEEKYANIPGQWGGILFLEGSKNNQIHYTDIRNAQFGVRVGTPDNDTIPDLIIKNSRIENTVSGGIVAFTSDLEIENCLVNTSSGVNLALLAGGNYQINHSTFANYPITFFQNGSSILISDNYPLDNGELLVAPFSLTLNNSIMWGTWNEEIVINMVGDQNNYLSSKRCILKTSLEIFTTEENYVSTNTDDFIFYDPGNYDYTPDSLSIAIDATIDSDILFDLFGQNRDTIPDVGAIEFLKSL